jgi:hypothetical protein
MNIAVTETMRCAACGQPLPPDAVICVQCGLDLTSGKKHRSQVMHGKAAAAASRPPSRWDEILEDDSKATALAARWDFLKPLFLLLIGLGIVVGWLSHAGAEAADAAVAANTMAALVGGYFLRLAVQVAVGVGGLWVAANLWLGGAGPLHLAFVRLAAIYVTVDVIWIALGGFAPAAFLVGLLSYLFLLMWLFELDLGESFMLALITFCLKLGVIALLIVLF